MKNIIIGLTILLVFGCLELYAEEYTHKYCVENGIAKTNKVEKQELRPLPNSVNWEGILKANCVEIDNEEQVLLLFKSKNYIFDKDVDEKLQTKLKEVLEYYKEKYELNTRLVVRLKGNKCYHSGNVILISLEVVKVDAIKMKWNEETLTVFILLHEIKHSIDYKYNRKQLIKDNIYSKKNKLLHNKRPHEKRANDFAKQEINKWIKQI